jgi:hypothetical protein
MPGRLLVGSGSFWRGRPRFFAGGHRRQKDDASADEEALYEQISRLKKEVAWLKKT